MKLLLLLMLLLPFFAFSQTSHYDSLYQKGLISKEDYQILNKSKQLSFTDSNTIKLNHIDTLYKTHQINQDDYNTLRNAILNKQDLQVKHDPVTLRQKAKNQNGWGIALSVGGTALTALGIAVNQAVDPVGGKVIASLGAVTWGSGIVCLIHAAVLRHRVFKYETRGF